MNLLVSALNYHAIASESETETETTTSVLLMALPKTVRIYILSFLGETQEELRELPLVSKQFYIDCKEPGIGWELLPLFVLIAKENNEDNGRTLNFIHTMQQHLQDKDTYRKLQRYSILKVENLDKFDHVPHYEFLHRKLQRYSIFEVENLDKFDQVPDDGNKIRMETKGIRSLLKGIRSLNMSSLPSTTMVPMNDSLPRALSLFMPNLHELNLSHTNFNSGYILIKFSIHCRDNLEKITWTNINIGANVDLDGDDMKYARNLKEIKMNDSNFRIMYGQEEAMSDLNNQPTIFLFHKCESQVLERVSIRNVKYYKNDNTSGRCLSQKMLIKFIRNAPATLKWFRSDLTHENMEMLTKERPGIQLLN